MTDCSLLFSYYWAVSSTLSPKEYKDKPPQAFAELVYPGQVAVLCDILGLAAIASKFSSNFNSYHYFISPENNGWNKIPSVSKNRANWILQFLRQHKTWCSFESEAPINRLAMERTLTERNLIPCFQICVMVCWQAGPSPRFFAYVKCFQRV